MKQASLFIHGSAYGPGGEGFLRVSFAAGGEVLNRASSGYEMGSCDLANATKPGKSKAGA